jgi:hypothetical protein
MTDPKRAQGGQPEQGPSLTSFVRQHDAEPIDVPAPPLAPEGDVDSFLDEWALQHFTASVKLHDAERLNERSAEAMALLQDVGVVQGVLLELHDFATHDARVRALMEERRSLQNGVGALYRWLEEVLEAAGAPGVARRRPSFVDAGEEALVTIVGALERLHPDLEELVRLDGVEPDVAQKLELCFRQIGVAVVRVSGRASSSMPPPR